MDRILRDFQRVVQQYQDIIPIPVLQYINLLEKLASNRAKIPEELTILTEGEMKAIAAVFEDCAHSHREDIIGAILASGAFLHLPGAGDREITSVNSEAVVKLADLIENFLPEEPQNG